jgi:hypothetical protein
MYTILIAMIVFMGCFLFLDEAIEDIKQLFKWKGLI